MNDKPFRLIVRLYKPNTVSEHFPRFYSSLHSAKQGANRAKIRYANECNWMSFTIQLLNNEGEYEEYAACVWDKHNEHKLSWALAVPKYANLT